MRALLNLLTELAWSLVFKIAPRQFPEDPGSGSTAADVAARTKFIRENRPPRPEGR